MIRDWYNLTLHNGTLEGAIIQFKDMCSIADQTQEMMQHYVDESHQFGDAHVVSTIVNYMLALLDPKADFIDEDAAPEAFVSIPYDDEPERA